MLPRSFAKALRDGRGHGCRECPDALALLSEVFKKFGASQRVHGGRPAGLVQVVAMGGIGLIPRKAGEREKLFIREWAYRFCPAVRYYIGNAHRPAIRQCVRPESVPRENLADTFARHAD